MCTSIFTKTLDKNYILSRTMDFEVDLEAYPTYIPRDYKWISQVDSKEYITKYGFIGAGSLGLNFVADGVNEYGLSIAELYLPDEVKYLDKANSNKNNFAPHELILYILGNCKSISEVEAIINNIAIINSPVPKLNIVVPLHWIITDSTGRCVVIEPTTEELKLKENPVGVMTNTPQLEWHIQNLRNYLNVRPKQYEAVKFGEYIAKPFSQGTGTSGLPGGYTPPERFVRAAFLKEYIETAKNEPMGITNAYHILNSVRIPKGVVITNKGTMDYTLYLSCMCNNSKTYYFSSYENHQINKLVLNDELLKKSEPIIFKYDSKNENFNTLTI